MIKTSVLEVLSDILSSLHNTLLSNQISSLGENFFRASQYNFARSEYVHKIHSNPAIISRIGERTRYW